MASLPLFDPIDDATRDWTWTVSELTARIRAALEGEFADVILCGEVSNLNRHSSGHVYFSLKDDAASIRARVAAGPLSEENGG